MIFDQVKVKATRRWKENGKPRQETRVFSQTINPFNKKLNGEVKTRSEIFAELSEEASIWIGGDPR